VRRARRLVRRRRGRAVPHRLRPCWRTGCRGGCGRGCAGPGWSSPRPPSSCRACPWTTARSAPFRRGGRRAGGGGGAGHELEQSGASSDADLLWRTEEAFHPLRGDHVALLCLRDPDRTPTMVATVHTDLEERSCRRVPTPPPARTARGHRASESCTGPPGMSWSECYGSRSRSPCCRAIRASPVSGSTRRTCGAGDLAVIDNVRVVHGRKPSGAGLDGNVTRDLRRFLGRVLTLVNRQRRGTGNRLAVERLCQPVWAGPDQAGRRQTPWGLQSPVPRLCLCCAQGSRDVAVGRG
jgi:hypothetical protein